MRRETHGKQSIKALNRSSLEDNTFGDAKRHQQHVNSISAAGPFVDPDQKP
jgi:hypothetical protein